MRDFIYFNGTIGLHLRTRNVIRKPALAAFRDDKSSR